MSHLTALLFIFLIFISKSINAEQIPVEAFGNLPEVSQVSLSPDGNKIAFLRIIKGSTYIGTTDLITPKTRYIVGTDNQKFKIGWYLWANNETLLISADYPVSRYGSKYTETRLLKVKADGSDSAVSVIKPKKNERYAQFQNNIIDILPDEPNHILMSIDLKIANQPDVYKINLKSERIRHLEYKGKSNINGWMTDQQHRLRLGFGRDDTKIFYRLYDLKTEKWRNIWEYEIFDAPDISPLGFGLNPNELYIRADHNGRYAIFKVDVSKPDLPRELVYADEKYDIEGSLIYSKKTKDVIGVYHGEANNAKVFFADEYAQFQKALNKAIPDTYNNVSSFSADEQKYILFTSSPTMPGAYFLGDRKAGSLSFVLEQYPLLAKKKLSGKDKISYLARDKTTIEGYITLPHPDAVKNNTALIIPHGGPMARNYGGFDWFTEFFASRGYTILEPNFRGSSGYGFDFEMASIKSWGGVMQDDLADAALWLTKNYEIAPSNVCIIGSSYGGYAALMAAVKQQDIFRCAGSFAGVSDLEYLVKKARKFTNYKVVKKQIGDDYDKLEQQSPINFAEKINIPVLLIHGDKDRVVDVKHSQKMRDELQDYNKDFEYIELENGNHHLEIEQNRVKTLSSFESFLQKNLLNQAN